MFIAQRRPDPAVGGGAQLYAGSKDVKYLTHLITSKTILLYQIMLFKNQDKFCESFDIRRAHCTTYGSHYSLVIWRNKYITITGYIVTSNSLGTYVSFMRRNALPAEAA